MIADEIISRLGLLPHPEGGHFRETWRHADPAGGRGAGTAIYFLHFYAGDPLELWIDDAAPRRLGRALLDGEEPQIIVPAHAWQRARSTGAYTLVGCTVSPAFSFDGFQLAPAGFHP